MRTDEQTGKALELKRVAMDVSVSQLAEAMRVPISSISRWESCRTPLTQNATRRYLEGLKTFGTVPDVIVSVPEGHAR